MGMAAPRNRSPGFSRRAQAGLFVGYVVALAGLIVSAVLLAISVLDPNAFGALRGGVAELTTPISSTLSVVGRGIGGIPGAVGNHFAIMRRNAAFEQQLRASRADIVRAQSLARENMRLRTLLSVRDRISERVTVARLVSSSATSTRRFAILNAGFRQGVGPGQPVRGPEGLVGRVLEAGPDTARILLLADAESVVPVRRSSDGLPAIATGRGDGLIEIKTLNLNNAAFKNGDLLVTSGVGGIFPPDIPVARVVGKTRDAVVARSIALPDTFDIAIVQRAFLPAMQPGASANQGQPGAAQ